MRYRLVRNILIEGELTEFGTELQASTEHDGEAHTEHPRAPIERREQRSSRIPVGIRPQKAAFGVHQIDCVVGKKNPPIFKFLH